MKKNSTMPKNVYGWPAMCGETKEGSKKTDTIDASQMGLLGQLRFRVCNDIKLSTKLLRTCLLPHGRVDKEGQ